MDKKEERRKEEEEEEEEEDHRYGNMSWVVWNYEYVYVNYRCMEI